jgi:hypothetical protein
MGPQSQGSAFIEGAFIRRNTITIMAHDNKVYGRIVPDNATTHCSDVIVSMDGSRLRFNVLVMY